MGIYQLTFFQSCVQGILSLCDSYNLFGLLRFLSTLNQGLCRGSNKIRLEPLKVLKFFEFTGVSSSPVKPVEKPMDLSEEWGLGCIGYQAFEPVPAPIYSGQKTITGRRQFIALDLLETKTDTRYFTDTLLFRVAFSLLRFCHFRSSQPPQRQVPELHGLSPGQNFELWFLELTTMTQGH